MQYSDNVQIRNEYGRYTLTNTSVANKKNTFKLVYSRRKLFFTFVNIVPFL